jgi:hypothetical protein
MRRNAKVASPRAGNSSARHALVESAWTYPRSTGTGVQHQQRQVGLPDPMRNPSYRCLMTQGKRDGGSAAIARKIAGCPKPDEPEPKRM